MTTWRHADEMHWSNHPDFHPVCMACVREIAKSPCTTPTPDPTSPCGELVRCCHLYEMPCGTAKADHGGIAHRHLPTRCTCTHPIEEEPR